MTPPIPLKTARTTIVHINGKPYQAEEGESILQIATRNRLEIPHFCYHEDLPIDANCRTCLVEIEETGEVVTSCTLKAKGDLRVLLDTPKVEKLRRENMELLFGDYHDRSPRAQHGYYSKTVAQLERYDVKGEKYERDDPEQEIHKLGTAAEFDPAMCIACNKCVEACQMIGISHLTLEGHDSKTRVSYNKDPQNDCIYCGQCTVHCPIEAIREQSHLRDVENALKDPKKIVIAQTAPSVRASIGESFGAPYGMDLTGKLCAAYRELGFDKVFDVNMGADITTMVEAEDLVNRLQDKWDYEEGKKLEPPSGSPMFTSCCPGWVKFLEFYEPDLIPHLTKARSPQIHSGGAYKTWWAEKEGIDPKNIVVVSMMPCTSKKYETHFEHLWIDGNRPVDYVLTTRELSSLIKTHEIDLMNLEPGEVDHEGTYSGAGAIYAASGGVMESALRTAYYMITGEELPGIEFEPVRGFDGVKKAEITIGDRELNLGVAAMPKNIRPLLRQIKKDPMSYDYIEFMACPGGCIGGGGQPIPSTFDIVKKRIDGVYKIDKKMHVRQAHNNPAVQEFFEYIKKQPKEKQDAILVREFHKKEKGQ